MSRKKPTPKQREAVAERAQHRCEYCQALKTYSPSPFNMEHIIPLSLGGLTNLDNLAYACYGCNRKKSDKRTFPDPLSGQFVPIYNPRKDIWSTHFTWSADNQLVVGLTPTGRATVEGLQLNRESLLNLRRVLELVLLHPP